MAPAEAVRKKKSTLPGGNALCSTCPPLTFGHRTCRIGPSVISFISWLCKTPAAWMIPRYRRGSVAITLGQHGLDIFLASDVEGDHLDRYATHLERTDRRDLLEHFTIGDVTVPVPPRRDWDRNITNSEVLQKITAIRALEMRGISVDVLTLDIGSADDVRAMLAARDRLGAPPIRGVIHAAGVTHDELLAFVSDGSMREVMWPKIQGAQVLDEAFPCGSVDFFYLTSSAASVFGVAGQGSYAAANAYLDALARARNRQAATASASIGRPGGVSASPPTHQSSPTS